MVIVTLNIFFLLYLIIILHFAVFWKTDLNNKTTFFI